MQNCIDIINGVSCTSDKDEADAKERKKAQREIFYLKIKDGKSNKNKTKNKLLKKEI